MKNNILLLAFTMLFSMIALQVNAQTNDIEDVVYLKNGSIVHGTIIEQIPNESLKISTKDGSVFVYKMADVDKMTKEPITNASTKNTVVNYSDIQLAKMGIPRYNQIKQNYSSRGYIPQFSDPYNPAVCGLCSFLIPGLGQAISGEAGRGFKYFGASIGCSIIAGIGGILSANSSYTYSVPHSGYKGHIYYTDKTGTDDTKLLIGTILTIAGSIGAVTVNILSIVDAVKVAKVKNMYVSDMRSKTSSLHLEVTPYLDLISMNNEIVRPVGLTMRVKF